MAKLGDDRTGRDRGWLSGVPHLAPSFDKVKRLRRRLFKLSVVGRKRWRAASCHSGRTRAFAASFRALIRRRRCVSTERISFVEALRWLATAHPGDELPELVVHPARPDRAEPRVRKRRPKEFPVMKKPRPVLRQELLAHALGA